MTLEDQLREQTERDVAHFRAAMGCAEELDVLRETLELALRRIQEINVALLQLRKVVEQLPGRDVYGGAEDP